MAGYLFVLPALLVFSVFHVFPTLYVFYLSLLSWNLVSPTSTFVWLRNFETILADPAFRQSLLTTAYFCLNVPIGMVVGLATALAMRRIGRGRELFQALYFLPTLTAAVAISIVFVWLYEPDTGLLNHALRQVGIRGPRWLGTPEWAMPSLILLGVWHTVGYKMVIYLAGLSSIPPDVYEAATVDGANAWQKTIHITWPLLMPVTLFILVTSTISSFQVFSSIYVMTQGGPLGATTTIVYLVYQNAFQFFKIGIAAAMSVVLLLILTVVALLQLRLVGSRTTYLG